MIHNLKPYPAYKDSGVQWLGEIPNTWRVLRGKNVFRVIDVKSETGDEELLTVSSKDGVLPRSQKTVTMFKAESYVGHKLCWPGDLVINSLWAWMQGLGFTKYHGLISSAYSVYRPLQEFSSYANYFNYALQSAAYKWELQTRSKGVWLSRLQLSDLAFLDMPIIIPPPAEQSAIVCYLDHIDRQIRRYIRLKQKLIKLLEEQKQAIIHQAVTRGLDPNIRLKPSGVEWLGEIPEHWEVRRVKQISQILRGKFTHRPRNDPAFYDDLYPFIQTGEVARAVKVITSFKQTLNDRGLAISKMFPRGTLVMTIAANIGDVAVLDFEACFPDSVVGFVPHNFVERDFLYYVFCAMKSELLCEAPVNTQGNLNVDRIGSREIGLPSFTEQREIVRFVEESTADLEQIMAVARSEISLLREYRTRLIADVVIGKLDVRKAAANLPEEIDEMEVLDNELVEDEETTEKDHEGEPEEET